MRLFAWLLFVSILQPFHARSAETAAGQLWCLSLQFQEGTDSFGDTLDLSTVSGTPNGELAPYNGLTYISGFSLDISGQPINGTMQLDLPAFMDVNSNGFNDFFESAIAVGAGSSGTYTTPVGNGTVSASWQRGAGSAAGTCTLHLVDSIFGDLGSFTHTFQLLEYIGPVLFTPGSNVVTGSINLGQTGTPANQIQGLFQFVKVSTNRFNRLILQAASWTNSATQVFTYTNALFRRDAPWTTNYFGIIQFADGDPDTASPDYLNWIWSINDSNDANHNGIPDFSDDPQGNIVTGQPILALTTTSSNLLLSVTGTVGHQQDIQQALSIPTTNWQTVVSVTLTNSTEILVVSNPSAAAAFWRVLAH